MDQLVSNFLIVKLINFFDCKIFLFVVKSWNDDLNSIDEKVNKEKVEEEEVNREEDEYNREFDAGKVSFFFSLSLSGLILIAN